MAGQTINVSVLADTKKFSSAMSKLASESGLSRLGSMAKTAAKAVATVGAAAGAGAVAVGIQATKAASNLEQSIGGMEAVFKGQSAQMHEWAKGAAQDMGLSRNAYNELATTIGTTLKNAGVPMDKLGGQTNDLAARSADLAATFGGPVTEASQAVASALRGEMEPLRRYGISLSAAAIEQRALADSGKASAKELTAQEKAMATQALIFEQSTDAAGAFARESNTLAGQTERLKAQFENMAARLGTFLLPVLTALVAWVGTTAGPAFESFIGWLETGAIPAIQTMAEWIGANLLPRLQEMGAWISGTVVPALAAFGSWLVGTGVPALAAFAGWLADNSAWLLPLAAGIAGAVAGFMAFQKALALWKAITAAAAAAQIALNLAMSANPVGLVIALLAGLVAAVVWLWTTNEGFRNAVTAIWQAITGFIGSAVQSVIGFFQNLGAVPGQVAGFFQSMKDRALQIMLALALWTAGLPGRILSGLGALGGMLSNTASSAFQAMRNAAVNKAVELVGWVRGLPGQILSGLGSLGSLLQNAGLSVIQGFIDGIRGAFGRVRDTLRGLTDMLPDWKGPAPRDAVILRKAGQLVIGGFNDGLRSRFGTVRRTLGSLTSLVAATPAPSLATPAYAVPLPDVRGAGSRIGTSRRYTVNVSALTPTREIGRAVVKAIREFEGDNGEGRDV